MAADQLWRHVASALHFDGLHGATSFPDALGHSWASFNGASLSTAQKRFGTASLAPNGGGIEAPYDPRFDIGAGPFKVTISVYPLATITGFTALWSRGSGTYYVDKEYAAFLMSNTVLHFYIGVRGSSDIQRAFDLSTCPVVTGQWNEIEVTRDLSGTMRVFVSGVPSPTTHDFSGVNLSGPLPLQVGMFKSASIESSFNGYIDEFRYWSRVGGHTIRYAPPTSAYDDFGTLPTGLAKVDSLPGNARPATRVNLRNLPHHNQNIYHFGSGKIVGTVAETGSPNMPLRRKVLLLRERGSVVVAQTWSDPVSGAYLFENINPDQRYTVISYDYEHNYRAVIADNLQPVPM